MSRDLNSSRYSFVYYHVGRKLTDADECTAFEMKTTSASYLFFNDIMMIE